MHGIVDGTEYEKEFDTTEIFGEAYQQMQDREGIPTYREWFIQNIYEIDTGYWERTGQNGAYVNLYGTEGMADLQVHDIEPGGETTRQNHLFEEIVFVGEGSGATIIGDEGNEITFEWDEKALFSLPSQTPYKHVNLSDSKVRLISQTTLPGLMFFVRDEDVIFNPPANVPESLNEEMYSINSAKEGTDEISSSSIYSTGDGRLKWEANFIPNMETFDQLQRRTTRGPERGRMSFNFSSNSMYTHITELPTNQRYVTAHRHGPGSCVLVLKGEGYSLTWPEGKEDMKLRVDWQPGTVVVPPLLWFHQHFTLSEERARFFAFHTIEKINRKLGIGEITHPHAAHNHISFVEEDPQIREDYKDELTKKGLEFGMPEECYTNPDYEFEN